MALSPKSSQYYAEYHFTRHLTFYLSTNIILLSRLPPNMSLSLTALGFHFP